MVIRKRFKADDLVPLKEAPSIFGDGWSRRSILRRIENNELKEGEHYINDAPPSSSRRKIKLIISGIEAWRGTLSYKR